MQMHCSQVYLKDCGERKEKSRDASNVCVYHWCTHLFVLSFFSFFCCFHFVLFRLIDLPGQVDAFGANTTTSWSEGKAEWKLCKTGRIKAGCSINRPFSSYSIVCPSTHFSSCFFLVSPLSHTRPVFGPIRSCSISISHIVQCSTVN